MPTWRVPPAGGAAGHALGGWSQRRVQRGAHSCVLCASPGRGRGRNPGVWPWGWATVSSVLGGLALGHGRDFGQQGWLLGKLLTQAGVAMPMVIAAGALAFFAWSLLFPLAPICPLLCLRSLLFFFFFFLSIYFWVWWVFVAANSFSSCSESELLPSYGAWASRGGGFSCGVQALGHAGFSSCSVRASVVGACGL